MDDARGGSAGNGAATASAASDSGGTSTASSGNGSSGANISSPHHPYPTTTIQDEVGGSSAGNGAATALTPPGARGTSTASSGNSSSRANVSSESKLRLNTKSCITHLSGSRPYRTFLRNSPIYLHDEKDNTTKGRTWIELLIIYRMMGGDAPDQADSEQKTIRWSLGQNLQHFRLQMRRTIKALCPQAQHRCITGQAKGQPLIHLGVTTHLTTLPITVPLTKEAETEVATRIIQSQASSSYKAANNKLQQKHWVIQHRLRTKGRTKWLDSIPKWKGNLFNTASSGGDDIPQPTTSTTITTNTTTDTNSNPLDDTKTTHTHQVRLPDIILLHCPTCRHATDGTKDKFQLDKLNHRTWCKACKKQRFVRLWLCRCGIPWHTCTTHQSDPDRLRRAKAPEPTSTNSTSTVTTTPPDNYQVGSSSVQQWLRQTPKKAIGNIDMDIVFTQKDQDIAKDMVTKRRKHLTSNSTPAHTLQQEQDTDPPSTETGTELSQGESKEVTSASSSGNGSVSAIVASFPGACNSTPGDPQPILPKAS